MYFEYTEVMPVEPFNKTKIESYLYKQDIYNHMYT